MSSLRCRTSRVTLKSIQRKWEKWTGAIFQPAALGFLIACIVFQSLKQRSYTDTRASGTGMVTRSRLSFLFPLVRSSLQRGDSDEEEITECVAAGSTSAYYFLMSSVKITNQNQLQHSSVWWSGSRTAAPTALCQVWTELHWVVHVRMCAALTHCDTLFIPASLMMIHTNSLDCNMKTILQSATVSLSQTLL